MISMLLAYDAAGNVVGTLDYLTARDENGKAIGLVDFAQHEAGGGKLRDIWDVEDAAGSATWPEWIGAAAHDFKVELTSQKRIQALVHKRSGFRRERGAIMGELRNRLRIAEGAPVDARDLLGGPERPLLLDQEGRTIQRPPMKRTTLPTVQAATGSGED